MSRNYLITGANGYLGSNIVEPLLKSGNNVIGLILEEDSWSRKQRSDHLRFIKIDITKPDELRNAFRQFVDKDTVVIHTAGIVSIASNISPLLEKVNIAGTQNIIDACLEYKPKKTNLY